MPNLRTSIVRGHGDYPAGNHLTRGWPIPLDVVEEDEHFIVHASVPGVDPKDLEITVADGVVTMRVVPTWSRSTRTESTRSGSGAYEFRRSLWLPE